MCLNEQIKDLKPKNFRGLTSCEAIEKYKLNEEFEGELSQVLANSYKMQICDVCFTFSFSDEIRYLGHDIEIANDDVTVEGDGCVCDECFDETLFVKI